MTLAENAFAFDGTVTRGPGLTGRDDTPDIGLRSVTFHINRWFKGGIGDTAVVDLSNPDGDGPLRADGAVPTYRIGTGLLVTGTPRWGGTPLGQRDRVGLWLHPLLQPRYGRPMGHRDEITLSIDHDRDPGGLAPLSSAR